MTHRTETPDTLTRARDTAVAAAHDAGTFLLTKRGHAQVQHKKALHDDLLDVDLQAEAIILHRLGQAFTAYGIQSEETGPTNHHTTYTWIVDPLDGSANFQHTNPIFGIAIGLVKKGVTLLSAIYLPTFDEMYTAIRGRGAECNGKPIHVSPIATLAEAIIHVGDFAKTGDHADNAPRVATVSRLADTAYRVRMIGTAATDFAYMACGRADGLVMYTSHPWDTKAGSLLVAEAGGITTTITDETGETFNICSNGHIHEELITLISPRQTSKRTLDGPPA